MAKSGKVLGTDEAWENGQLGAADHSAKPSPRAPSEVEDALELQLISIRLPNELIRDLKLIAQREGLKYQPLMRRFLQRNVDCEMKKIVREMDAAERAARKRA